MEAHFSLEGVAALEAQLNELGVEVALKSLARVARKAFLPVLDAARALAPIESGELRDAVKVSVVKPSGGESVVVVGLKIGRGSTPGDGGAPAARRWHFTELGTAFMSAHPFLRPALDQNAERVLGLLKEGLVAEIQRVLRKQARGR